MSVRLVAALDENFAIGKQGGLPWHLPDDLRYFKTLTMDKAVLMGRKTAESIGRALPGRVNYVLSRKGEAPFPGQVTVRSVSEAQASCGHTGLMVIGGGEVFREALPMHARFTSPGSMQPSTVPMSSFPVSTSRSGPRSRACTTRPTRNTSIPSTWSNTSGTSDACGRRRPRRRRRTDPYRAESAE